MDGLEDDAVTLATNDCTRRDRLWGTVVEDDLDRSGPSGLVVKSSFDPEGVAPCPFDRPHSSPKSSDLFSAHHGAPNSVVKLPRGVPPDEHATLPEAGDGQSRTRAQPLVALLTSALEPPKLVR
jgi:hypothetical protein